ncbi:MAD2L1-binding protein [Venturia canescens]|uniref:MAD2L1-binding protein n=1 Tax=Venturia canescens TaxID=32260 RepID=UPI001C9C99A5|nr:MAD2L1-binding protein-like [Venturia canescens]
MFKIKMFARKKQYETCISVSLDEPLTSDSCSKLIMEFIKYILYEKEQIPFSFDTLTELQTRLKPNDKNASSTKTVLAALRNISENLTSQLHTNGCEVREVIVIIGATMLSPKLCVRLELPQEILNSRCHMEYQHSSRKPLLNLMRSIVECEEFQEAMTVPLGVTNTFVLLQKSDSNPTSDFFLPKPQYIPPTQATTCFAIKFRQNSSEVVNCHCKNVIKIYHDFPQIIHENNDSHNDYNSKERQHNYPYLWYQSREVIKGFKFIR